MAITREQVIEAADTIYGERGQPTYINVRARLGSGSFSTISKYLREWRAPNEETKPLPVVETPEEVTRAIHAFGAEVWRVATSWTRAEIEAARSAFVEKARDAESEVERAAATVDTLQDELTSTTKERDELRAEAAKVTAELSQAKGALAEARAHTEALEKKVADLSTSLAEETKNTAVLTSEKAIIDELVNAKTTELMAKRTEAEKLATQLASAQGALTEVRKRAEVADERTKELELHNRQLGGRLNKETEKAATATERVKQLEEALKT